MKRLFVISMILATLAVLALPQPASPQMRGGPFVFVFDRSLYAFLRRINSQEANLAAYNANLAGMQVPVARVVTVGVFDNYFAPPTIYVPPGTTVRWVNYGRQSHTVTSVNGAWDSGAIATGMAFAATFDVPGVYPYFCSFHTRQQMRGTVVVGY